MLTQYDEFLCHQLSTTFDHVGTSDPKWTERVVVYGFDTTSGNLNFMTGLARYANRNVMDAYGMVTLENKTAHVVRVSRELRPDAGLRVGPYAYEVTEPLKRVRIALDDNAHDLSFQLDFEGTFPAYEQNPAYFRSRGRVIEDARRYYQSGRLSGWFKVAGKRYEADAAKWLVGRDHSWGVRRGGGGGSIAEPSYMQPEEIPQGVLYFMGIFRFKEWMVHFAQREDWEGKRWHFEGRIYHPFGSEKEKEEVPVLGVEHDFQFRSDLRLIQSGRVIVSAGDGSKREISIRPVTRFWPGLAGYDYFNDYMSGMWKGPSFMDGFSADVTDLELLRRVSMLTETLCEVRCGAEMGYGLVEMVFLGKYPRYGYEGYGY
jgi:hypothetical protein